jgi:hypothetical protein
MKSVLRLIYTYFCCTPAQKIFSIGGATAIVVSYVLLVSVAQSWLLGALAVAGIASLCMGSSMMPLMFGRMARGHMSGTLPGFRIKLLASALVVVLIVSTPAPVLAVYGLRAALPLGDVHPTAAQIAIWHRGIMQTFWITYSSTILLTFWIYIALWFITSKRNTLGYLQGLIVIAVLLLAPSKHIVEPDSLIAWDMTVSIGTLLTFGALFLLWPRLRTVAERLPLSRLFRFPTGQPTRTRGREVDLLLGTANPWVLGIGQLLPVLLAARIGFYSAAVWLFYLTIFSTVAGAIAGQAAERSRALWLRGDWSTAQLFALVERSFWRHNNFVLGILLILMVAIGSYADLPVMLLVTGLPLLILGTVLSTSLGLMLTQRLRWAESLLAIVIMLALMAIAVLAARNSADLAVVGLLEAALAITALGLRYVARSRWTRIDWMQCRADRALSGRSAA